MASTRAHESWGLVVDEALALRLPMVLPRTGALAERLTEGAGALFFEPDDPDSLTKVLRRLLDEPELVARVRDALPPLEEAVPSVARQVGAHLELYERVASEGAPEVAPADWWKAEMQSAKEREWDESLSRRTAEELGFS